eukprot:g478.t1
MSWCALFAELPAVAGLAFNIWASVLALIGSGLIQAVSGKSPELPEGELPAMIRPGYRPPLLTSALWGSAAGSACAAAWALLTASSTSEHAARGSEPPTLGAAVWTPACALAFALGFGLAVHRLARWRLFTGDFLREVHRIKEMSVLDDILSQLSQQKREKTSKNSETESSKLSVLDFGGGKGKTAAHLKRHPSVASVASIDIAAHPPHVSKYDGHNIPFEDGHFDLAVCLYVFHHIPHTADLVKQLARKAKRVLIFEDLPEESPSPLVARLTFGAHFLLFDQSVHTHLHHSKEEWRRLLEKEWGCLSVLKEFRIPPTAALPYERVALYCKAKELKLTS